MPFDNQFSIVESLQFQIRELENKYQSAIHHNATFAKLKQMKARIDVLKETLRMFQIGVAEE